METSAKTCEIFHRFPFDDAYCLHSEAPSRRVGLDVDNISRLDVLQQPVNCRSVFTGPAYTCNTTVDKLCRHISIGVISANPVDGHPILLSLNLTSMVSHSCRTCT